MEERKSIRGILAKLDIETIIDGIKQEKDSFYMTARYNTTMSKDTNVLDILTLEETAAILLTNTTNPYNYKIKYYNRYNYKVKNYKKDYGEVFLSDDNIPNIRLSIKSDFISRHIKNDTNYTKSLTQYYLKCYEPKNLGVYDITGIDISPYTDIESICIKDMTDYLNTSNNIIYDSLWVSMVTGCVTIDEFLGYISEDMNYDANITNDIIRNKRVWDFYNNAYDTYNAYILKKYEIKDIKDSHEILVLCKLSINIINPSKDITKRIRELYDNYVIYRNSVIEGIS